MWGWHMIRRPESAVDLKIGDRIRLRSRFTRLYQQNSGVIVEIIPDPIRSLFNEYLVEFADQSVDNLFQFQIYQDESRESSLQSQA